MHSLSRAQTQAVREVMRLFAEDDVAHGITATARRCCECCRRDRPAAGFIDYAGAALCNTCATAYELARLRHAAGSVAEFAATARSRRRRRSCSTEPSSR